MAMGKYCHKLECSWPKNSYFITSFSEISAGSWRAELPNISRGKKTKPTETRCYEGLVDVISHLQEPSLHNRIRGLERRETSKNTEKASVLYCLLVISSSKIWDLIKTRYEVNSSYFFNNFISL